MQLGKEFGLEGAELLAFVEKRVDENMRRNAERMNVRRNAERTNVRRNAERKSVKRNIGS